MNRPGPLLLAGVVALLSAAPATADGDADDGFGAAIAALRAGVSAPLRPDPLAGQVAEISNRSTADYLDHTARHVPVDDPLAVLHDLGGRADTAIQLQGYGPDAASAIKGALLQGHSAIRDCTYTVVGTSVIHDDAGAVSAVAVLADR